MNSSFGKEDARGFWAPKEPVSYGPAFDWPPHPRALLKWFFGFPGYLLPWNVLYAVAAILIWMFLTPSLETFEDFFIRLGRPDPAPQHRSGHSGLRCMAPVALCLAQAGHHLQIQPAMAEGTSPAFLFNNQTYDNMFHTLVSGVPIWTAYEVLLLWAYANNIAPMISFRGTSGGLHRSVLSGALYPRGRILFRAPPAALAAAL